MVRFIDKAETQHQYMKGKKNFVLFYMFEVKNLFTSPFFLLICCIEFKIIYVSRKQILSKSLGE